MDLFSQAEHDELAQSILLCPDAAYIDAVQAAIDRLLPEMPRKAIIAKSLSDRGALILTKDMEEACAISNRIAPEHLEVSSRDPHRWEPLLRHAGAIFLGAYTSESLGDYCAGPNHVLPTSGTARFPRRWGCTTSRSAAPSSKSARPVPRSWARPLPCWPMAKACRATPGLPKCA
jgi:histidinol dehydrogenase